MSPAAATQPTVPQRATVAATASPPRRSGPAGASRGDQQGRIVVGHVVQVHAQRQHCGGDGEGRLDMDDSLLDRP